jgi:hypothetical protein
VKARHREDTYIDHVPSVRKSKEMENKGFADVEDGIDGVQKLTLLRGRWRAAVASPYGLQLAGGGLRLAAA